MMKDTNPTSALRQTIVEAQDKQAMERILLKEQVHATVERFQPLNLMKDTINQVAESTEIQNGVVNNGIGIATGYLTKKILLGSSTNPIKKILGTLVQIAVTNIAAKHGSSIQSGGKNLLLRMLKQKKELNSEANNNNVGQSI